MGDCPAICFVTTTAATSEFSDMLALSCCHRRCSDLFQLNDGTLYPHTVVWDCTRRHGPRRPDEEVDPFYEHFGMLPNEMKLECMSYVPFHVIANHALWLDDTDPWFTKKIMWDKHVTGSACPWCKTIQPTFLCLSPQTLSVCLKEGGTFAFHREKQSWRQLFKQWPSATRGGEIDQRFGGVNRYPSFYFRSCSHHDQPLEERQNNSIVSVLERWSRLRRLGGTKAESVQTVFRSRIRIVYDAKKTDSPGTPLRGPATTKLKPGMYYFELVNYNWEERVASSVEGVESRQRHFFIDPLDPSHGDMVRQQTDMSLLLRKVCHPSEETTDRFETVGYFERKAGVDERTNVYFNLGDDEDDSPTPATVGEEEEESTFVMSPQMVYMHTLTPTHGVHVYRCDTERRGDNVAYAGSRKKVSYFCASFPPGLTLHSLQRNKNTVRLNIFTETLDEGEQPALLPSEGGYAFVPIKSPFLATMMKASSSLLGKRKVVAVPL